MLVANCSYADAQTSCLNKDNIFGSANDLNNNTTYPAGSTIYSDGVMNLIKTGLSNVWGDQTTFLGINSVSIDFMGLLTLDFSKTTCVNRKVTLEGVGEWILVDGDTVITQELITRDYIGLNFGVSNPSGPVYVVTGNFSRIDFGGGTSLLYGACVDMSNCAITGLNDVQGSSGGTSTVYPNPTNGDFSIAAGNSNATVKIFNTLGELMYTSFAAANSILTVNEIVSPGIYFVHVIRNGTTEITKLVKR